MAYKYTKGIKLSELQNMDPEKLMAMPEPALRETVRRLADAANKRIKRAGADNVPPAVYQAKRGGKFSTARKDVTALRNEYLRARMFLSDPTSTKEGWKDFQKDLSRKMAKEGWIVDPENIPILIDRYARLVAAEGTDLTRGERYKYMREAVSVVTSADGSSAAEYDYEDIAFDLATALEEMGYSIDDDYSTRDTWDGGVSQFFDLQ